MGLFSDFYQRCRSREVVTAVCIVFTLGLIIMTITLLALCVNKKVSQDKVLVLVNQYTTNVRGPFEQGTYTIQPGDNMINFQRTIQDSGLSNLTCLTGDVVYIDLTLTAQIQYQVDHIIPEILYEFGDENKYRELYRSLLTSAFISGCGQYKIASYYVIRGPIETGMLSRAQNLLGNSSLTTNLQLFQLVNVDYPEEYNDIVLAKQSTQQQETTALNNRLSQLIIANTTLLQAEQNANILMIQANLTSTVNLQNANTQAAVTEQQWLDRTAAYLSIKQNLGLTNEQFLLYLQSQIISSSEGAYFSI